MFMCFDTDWRDEGLINGPDWSIDVPPPSGSPELILLIIAAAASLFLLFLLFRARRLTAENAKVNESSDSSNQPPGAG